jgi:hypothetical protein
MELWQAALWGLIGGAVAQSLRTAADVKATNFRWPWLKEDAGGFSPYLFVAFVSLASGGVVAAAAHGQMTGPWPAMIMGITAPSVVRGVLSGIEVSERKPDPPIGHDNPTEPVEDDSGRTVGQQRTEHGGPAQARVTGTSRQQGSQ